MKNCNYFLSCVRKQHSANDIMIGTLLKVNYDLR